jgi:uncharacterized protein YyaL (SSP411 family)
VRAKPARDEKVLTGWNGLMLAAFVEAARVLKRDDPKGLRYREIAARNAAFLLRELRRDAAGGTSPRSGTSPATIRRLHRSWKAGDVRHRGISKTMPI